MNGRHAQPRAWLSYELSLVGGYCDAASFVLTKTFTGHVTGNLVLAGIAVASHNWRTLISHLSAISAFLFGTVISMLAIRRLQRWTTPRFLTFVMLMEAFLIASACLITVSNVFARMEIFLVLMSLGLGLQNGSFTRAGGIGVHTTYITGVITSLLSAETEGSVANSSQLRTQEPAPGLGILSRIWIFFVVGAGFGAMMALHYRGLGLLGAVALLCVFACLTSARE